MRIRAWAGRMGTKKCPNAEPVGMLAEALNQYKWVLAEVFLF